MASVQIADIRKSYGATPVIHGVSVDIEDGAPAKVIVVEPTGAETHLAVSMAGHELVCLLRERVSLHVNETVKLSFRKSAVHFFDPASTMRL